MTASHAIATTGKPHMPSGVVQVGAEIAEIKPKET